ncbi:MAG: dihydroorotate dehydrogenase electron transfer subunit [Planctomycetota bacterium]|jgi:dihydroorotate dehydrogenase electron transfer subunit
MADRPLNAEIESHEAAVVEVRDVRAGYTLLSLDAPGPSRAARPGQFLTLAFPDRTDPLLPRPFAVFDAEPDADPEAGLVRVLFNIVGRGTRLLAEAKEGDRLRLVAPLGRGWRAGDEEASVLVAGGTGWAALHMLARTLSADGRDVRAVWGQSCEASFPDLEAVAARGVPFVLASDDGSCGRCGTAVDCARELLENDLAGRRIALYGAGPIPMMSALASFARERDIPCQVSLEARMACGIGVCRGCVVNALAPHPESGLRRRTVCADGPVFDARELDWENLT